MPLSTRKVLIIPSGTEIGLEAHDALHRRRDLEVFGAESTDNTHASFVYRNNQHVRNFDHPEFVESVNKIITRQKIDCVLPAHDDVQLALLQAGSSLACPVLSSPLETVEVTRFKARTYAVFKDALPVPMLWPAAAREVEDSCFPLFLKPDRGHGSQNTHICYDRSQLTSILGRQNDMLVCEYLPGREVTVDCFSDRNRGLLLVEPRLRGRTRAGISVRSTRLLVPQAGAYAEIIAARLRLFGAWFFQLKERSPGDWVLLEIGARLPGGATYQRLKGINLPLLTIFEHERQPLEILSYPLEVTMDRAFISRFKFDLAYETIYVDFDDTLSIREGPNLELVMLLVAARHHGKRLVLLSRNKGDCTDWLRQHGLADLFHHLVLLDRHVPKHSYMEPSSILIDDSFSERKACHEAGRLCVDSDAASALTMQLRKY
jgi:carbamoyl-phosphate synthase large subunit